MNTYAGRTLASMGLTLGSCVYNWGDGQDADSFTISIIPEPSHVLLVLLGLVPLLSA
jgi:hypothetical protein